MTPRERHGRRADARLVPGAVAAWGAAWVAPLVPLWVSVMGSLLAALGAGAVVAVPAARRRAVVAVVLVCVAAAGLVSGLRTAADRAGPVTELARRGGEAGVELTVRTDPERRVTRVRGSELGAPPTVFAARIERVGDTRVRTPVTVLASGPDAGAWLGLLPSTPIRTHGRFVEGRAGGALLLVRAAPEPTGAAAPISASRDTCGPGSGTRARGCRRPPAACCRAWSWATRAGCRPTSKPTSEPPS